MEKVGLIAIFDVSNFNRGLKKYLSGVDKANDAAQQGEKSGFNFARALEVAVGGALLQVANLAGRAAGSMLNFGADSIGVAADFESQLAILQTAAASTGKSADEFGQIAMAVGADSRILGASASGAAEAMTGLFKSGLDSSAVFGDLNGFMEEGAELGGALRASFDLAAASELSVAQASDLAVIALSTFGGEMEEGAEQSEFINDALNNLVQAADASVAEVADLGEAISLVGPSANSFGMSIQDTTNALAVFSTAGITGSSAGTTLDAVLRDLQKGTPQSTAALEELGVAIHDVNTGETRPFVDILGDLEGALEGKTDAAKAAALQDIFTAQGMRGINVLIEQGTEGWYDMADATATAATSQEQAALRTQTFAGQTEALEGQIETLQIMFGSALLPALTGFIEIIIPIIEQHMPLMESVFKAVGGALVQVVNGFSSLLSGDFAEGIAGIGQVIENVFGEGARRVFVSVAIFLREKLPEAMSFFRNSSGEAFTFVQSVIQKFLEFFNTIAPIIQPIIEQVKIFFSGLKDNSGLVWEGIKTIIMGALDIILGAVTTFISLWTGDWDAALQSITQMTKGAWDILTGIVEVALALVASMMGTTADEIFGQFEGLWKNLQTGASAAWDALTNIFSSSLDENVANLKTGFTTMITILKSFGTEFFNIGKNVVSSLASGIKAAASSVASAIEGVVQGAIQAAKNKLGIQSPSKVFASIGLNVMQGMEGGIVAGSQLPRQALSTGLDSLISSPITNSNVTNIDNSRTASVEINNSGPAGIDSVFYDVVGALGAVGLT